MKCHQTNIDHIGIFHCNNLIYRMKKKTRQILRKEQKRFRSETERMDVITNDKLLLLLDHEKKKLLKF